MVLIPFWLSPRARAAATARASEILQVKKVTQRLVLGVLEANRGEREDTIELSTQYLPSSGLAPSPEPAEAFPTHSVLVESGVLLVEDVVSVGLGAWFRARARAGCIGWG